MINQIAKNEVSIRGMLVGTYPKEDRTTAVICARSSKDNPNYQYVTFFGEEKKIVDSINICESVCVTASAWIYRDKDTKFVNPDNLRLRGKTIELTRDFKKRTLASVGVPMWGLQLKDCARFAFNGSIVSIKENKNHKVSILLGVSEEGRDGFNIIPLIYTGKGADDVKKALATYHKGNVVSVKGFISQKTNKIEGEDGKILNEHKNTYFITSFLTSETEANLDEAEI